MATSPSHRFGQIIGEVLETALQPSLVRFARKHRLYLDQKGPRPARPGSKLTWTDAKGNKHDLDFVLERGGTAQQTGIPVAFIETAWRRYTKHSRNKAQEIQGAIVPLAQTHHTAAPFIGVVLAGVFTEGALSQLRSLGFAVVYFSYEAVVKAFRSVGMDAAYDEHTPDSELLAKVNAWAELPLGTRAQVATALIRSGKAQLDVFLAGLERAVGRQIESVRVLPLHGVTRELPSAEEAIAFVQAYGEASGGDGFVAYEVQVRFNNGDRIDGRFADKDGAVKFLAAYLVL